jgi:type VI secretion system protein ImpL
MNEYLAHEHEDVRLLALDMAHPLVAVLQRKDLPQDPKNTTLLARWTAIIDSVSKAQDKKPGSTLTALETFIRTDMDKITPENHCAVPSFDPTTADFFVRQRNTALTIAEETCRRLVIQRYNAIATAFTAKLAGRFPFASEPPVAGQAQTPESAPEDINAFFTLFDQRSKGLADALDQFGPSLPGSAAAAAFLRRLDQVHAVFPPVTPDKDPTPALDLSVQFRTNRDKEIAGNQIIDWTLDAGDQMLHYRAKDNTAHWRYGDSAQVVMRYAKDSPSVPTGGSANDVKLRQRMVTWQYTDKWGLFALLSRHASNEFAPPGTKTLRFSIPLAPDPGQFAQPGDVHDDTRVYLQLTLNLPGKKEPVTVPDFPAQAPPLALPTFTQTADNSKP